MNDGISMCEYPGIAKGPYPLKQILNISNLSTTIIIPTYPTSTLTVLLSIPPPSFAFHSSTPTLIFLF